MIAPRRPGESARVWTVADLIAWTEARFRKLSFPSPRLDAELLLAHAMNCTRLELYTGYRRAVEPQERDRFRSFVERRSRSEPVAYITGFREFHSLRFEVSPEVLIPRPETEHLVDEVAEFLSRLQPPRAEVKAEDPSPGPAGGTAAALPSPEVKVLDLGTGSGNISVAILVEVPGSRVLAVDSSAEALAVARRNAGAHGVLERIELLEGDLFEPLLSLPVRPRFHAIASNPPYIAPSERESLPRDVRDYEPAAALFDLRDGPDGDGLGFHRAILREARSFLLPGGLLAVEVGAGQAPRVIELFQDAGLASVRWVADYGGIQRVVLGEAPGELGNDGSAGAPESP